MRQAYLCGDPYLAFAQQAGAVPQDATKETHRQEREQFKVSALAVQYGMGPKSLAVRLGVTFPRALELLRLHKATYPTYWRWSREVGRHAREEGRLQAAFGWPLHVGPKTKPRTVKNFPLQANGSEMLRLACCVLTEAGVRVGAPVHDALLVEAPANDIDQVILKCRGAMEWASRQVLKGFTLRTDAKVVRHPDRYLDPRGVAMWDTVLGLLGPV
jgi:DNA polymerase I-like protein with 3'-5' exonuclease and polymerase domains